MVPKHRRIGKQKERKHAYIICINKLVRFEIWKNIWKTSLLGALSKAASLVQRCLHILEASLAFQHGQYGILHLHDALNRNRRSAMKRWRSKWNPPKGLLMFPGKFFF